MKPFSSALVTGATGFIGKALVEHLVSLGIDTYCLIRNNSNIQLPDNVHLLRVPEFSTPHILQVTQPIHTDIIFHLAAYGVLPQARDPLITANINIMSAAALLEAAKDWNLQQFIHVGSCAEYGMPQYKTPITEDHPLKPLSIYGASKTAAQIYLAAMAQHYQLPFLHLRLFGVYGPGEADYRLAPAVIKALLNNQKALLSPGLQIRDFLYIDDVVKALMKATTLTDQYNIFNVCSNTGIAVNSIVKTIAAILQKPASLLDFGAVPMRPDETMWLVGDNTKFVSAMDWKPLFNLEQGLTKTINVLEATINV